MSANVLLTPSHLLALASGIMGELRSSFPTNCSLARVTPTHLAISDLGVNFLPAVSF